LDLDPPEYAHGRGARLHGPQGNPMVLWEMQ
jgi:hypothetical protein